ncbi:MAG: hypothetical protein LBE30_00550 [Comamonas sp.]|jgi:hypothetical protein|nr:hypothetical protein [Comamonas sp.]
MIPSTYDGPSNGDYVAYVDKLLRASPDFRRTQSSIAGAVQSAISTPGAQADSPVGQLREKLQKARELAEQAERKNTKATVPNRAAQRQTTSISTGQATSKEEAKQRFRAMEREIEAQKVRADTRKSTPWISPFSVVMIVAGVVISQFASGFGMMLAIMGLLSLVSGVTNKLKGK